MTEIIVGIKDEINVDKVATIISEKLKQDNIPFSLSVSSISQKQIEAERELLSKPILIGEKIAVKALTVRNRHYKLLDGYDLPDKVVVNIDPHMSAGVGTHPTTQMCVEAIESYLKQGANVLDIGCGSGILSIISLLLGASRADGVDLESSAVNTAKKNAELNNVQDRFNAVQGNLLEKIAGQYDLVVANLLADPLIALGKDLKSFVHEDSTIILSGIIDFREEEVLAAMHDFQVIERQERDNWICLVLKLKNN